MNDKTYIIVVLDMGSTELHVLVTDSDFCFPFNPSYYLIITVLVCIR